MPVVDGDGNVIDARVVVSAYLQGAFPMAEHREGPFAWYRPEERAIITWDRFVIPRSLKKTRKKTPYRITFDTAFAEVIRACAQARDSTWISHDVEALYGELFQQGIGHSVEAWDPVSGTLVGGCYGLAIGTLFSGESMFHVLPDAAKLCVVALAEHLQTCGFQILDCQQQSDHMQRFGAYEVSLGDYMDLLENVDPNVNLWQRPNQ